MMAILMSFILIVAWLGAVAVLFAGICAICVIMGRGYGNPPVHQAPSQPAAALPPPAESRLWSRWMRRLALG